jgi:hypothetical protein
MQRDVGRARPSHPNPSHTRRPHAAMQPMFQSCKTQQKGFHIMLAWLASSKVISERHEQKYKTDTRGEKSRLALRFCRCHAAADIFYHPTCVRARQAQLNFVLLNRHLQTRRPIDSRFQFKSSLFNLAVLEPRHAVPPPPPLRQHHTHTSSTEHLPLHLCLFSCSWPHRLCVASLRR